MISNRYYTYTYTTAHSWCDGHFTGTYTCEVWGARTEVQVSRREPHTYTLRLGYSRILSCIYIYILKKKGIIHIIMLKIQTILSNTIVTNYFTNS